MLYMSHMHVTVVCRSASGGCRLVTCGAVVCAQPVPVVAVRDEHLPDVPGGPLMSVKLRFLISKRRIHADSWRLRIAVSESPSAMTMLAGQQLPARKRCGRQQCSCPPAEGLAAIATMDDAWRRVGRARRQITR